MNYRSLALAVAALSSIHVASADAQSVYVAPGGVYVGSGPVYVIPAPNNGAPRYVAPTYGYEYGPPAVMTPGPAGYYGAPLSGYAAELPPRPPAAVPYYGSGRCVARYGYSRQSCY